MLFAEVLKMLFAEVQVLFLKSLSIDDINLFCFPSL